MKKKVNGNYLWIAFGVGTVVALVLPSVWTMRVLAIAVIILGVICCKKSDNEKC